MTRSLAVRVAIALAVGLSAVRATPAAAQLFRRPVECDTCISDYYYLDHGGGRDWNCSNSTYADHAGSDYSLRGGNFAIDGNHPVVAMAPGVVVHSEDGYYDRCTRCGGSNCGTGIGYGFANQVIINHGPYRTIYGHMKMGSIAVQEGDMVECGQVIGFIGSSGCSTGAHLHIEPSLAANFGRGRYTPIDPYAGDCSPTDPSMFVDQGAHRTLPSAMCDDTEVPPACPPDTYPIWTCTEDGAARRRCVDGMVTDEACAWGCTAMPTGTDDVCAMPPDADGDGSRADTDCNDADPAIHPGAMEICGDGVDQECSGADMTCPIPPAGGTMATEQPSPGGAGAPGQVAGQSGAPGGPGAPVAPPLGQAGMYAAGAGAGAGIGWAVPAADSRRAPAEGCAVSAVGDARAASRRGPWLAGAALLLLGGRLRRRRG